MAIPKQVEQQMKEVEEMERALTVKSEGEAQPEPVAETQPEQETPTEVVAQAPVVEAKPVEDWEQKYHSLRGHFDAEVPRLHQQNKDLAAQIQAMQQQLMDMQKPKPQEQEQQPLVSDKDKDEFGSDLVDFVDRAVRNGIAEASKLHGRELAARDAKIAQLEAQLGKTGGDIANLTFEQQLERAIPDFATLNTSVEWVSWLNEVDPYTREPRRSYATQVYNQGDIAKLKQIVDFYKESTGKQEQQQERQQRKTELERQVQPSRTASSSTVPQAGRIYTEVEANRLWNKVRELYASGKNDEASPLEAELTHAYTSGRIRP